MLRRVLGVVAVVVVVLVAGVGAMVAVLGQADPVPGFSARRGLLDDVRVDSATVDSGHVIQPVRVASTSGLAVEMLVKRPVGEGRRPLVLILGGHNTGRDAARLIPDTRGRVVVALNYPYDGPHRIKGLAALRWAPDIRRALLDTPPAIQLALDWLVQQPWVDSTRIDGVGASLGTPLMTVAAALDPRITRLWSVHGAGDTRTLLEHNARKAVPEPLRPLAGHLANVLVAGPYLTPEKWVARVAPRPFVMINATEDERLPRAAIDTLYAAARDPKHIVWLPGPHVQRNRPEVVRALVSTVITMMESDSLAATPVVATGAR